MNVNDYLYSTTSLMGLIEPLRSNQAPRFLLDLLCPNMDEQETEEIHLDKVAEDLRIAAFVSPLVPGKARPKRGYQTSVFTPAYIKELDNLFPRDLTRRLAGEPLGGSLSAEQRADAHIANLIGAQRTRIRRRLEVMASKLGQDMALTISGEDYDTVVIDYGRTASFRKTLTSSARWGESGVVPSDDLDGWLNDFGAENGSAGTDVIFTPDSWKLFKKDTALKDILDRTMGQTPVVDLGFTANLPGAPVHKGMIDNVNLWVYNDKYEDTDGVVKNLLPDHTVMIVGRPVINGYQSFGLIQDFESLTAMDMFSKTWAEKNPSALNVLTQSAPLLVPSRPNGVMFVTVR